MAPKTVVITGCSEGGLGDALAREFHARGLHVIATGRNQAKIAHFEKLGIETQLLDVLSEDSIKECVSSIGAKNGNKVDILVNNSGGGYSMPLTDVSLAEARKLYDLNVWSVLGVTQAFLPLLLKSDSAMIVNNTSIVSVLPGPFAGIYNSSKAAVAMLTDNLRLELKPFGVKVIDLRTGAVKSKFFSNQTGGKTASLPEKSIYLPAKATVEKAMSGDIIESGMLDSDRWAAQVVGDILRSNPPDRVWRGGSAWLIWFVTTFLPRGILYQQVEKMMGMDKVHKAVNK